MMILSKYKYYILYVSIALLIILGVLLYTNYAVFKIANTSYTYSDIEKYHHVEEMVAEVRGGDEISRSDVVYNLSLAALQKHYLAINNISFTRLELTQAVEDATELKGLYKKIKDYLGNDYFRLFIEPVAMGQVAANVFNQNNPRDQIAQSLLQNAINQGLQATAAQAQIALIELNLEANQSNNELTALLQSWVNGLNKTQEEAGKTDEDNASEALALGAKVFPRVIDVDNRYLVLAYKEENKTGTGSILETIQIEKLSYAQYMSILARQFPPRFTWISLYNIEDMQAKRNSIY